MDINDYQIQRKMYYKVLFILLALTGVHFLIPEIIHTGSFVAQLAVAVVKAWFILMFYMHLKGDKLIGSMTIFSLALVTVFFIIVIAVDVTHFQFGSESYITSAPHAN